MPNALGLLICRETVIQDKKTLQDGKQRRGGGGGGGKKKKEITSF